MRNRLKRQAYYLIWSVFAIATGGYTLLFTGYLDNPRITPPPPPSLLERSTVGWVDDQWFGVVLLFLGLLILYGIVSNRHRFRDIAMTLLAIPLGMLSFTFAWRGLLDTRPNVSWLGWATLLVLLIWGLRKGERGNG